MSSESSRVAIIGAGIGGLATACLLAQDGHAVDVYEKNEQTGGRACVLEADGFRFDMGPSWYLMPDVFEHFFALLGERIEDHLKLTRLSPSYRIFFKGEARPVDLFGERERDRALFDSFEPAAGQALDRYLLRAGTVYETSRQWFLYRNYDSLFDFLDRRSVLSGAKLGIFSSMGAHVNRFFNDERLRKIIEYPLVFLGGSPDNTPALYQLMSHLDFSQGVFYPQGGISEIIRALERLAVARGVRIHLNCGVHQIQTEQERATGLLLEDGRTVSADLVISNADYAFTERVLLRPKDRSYSERYWESRVMAPSAFILYLGVKGRIPTLVHHNLIFSEDWKVHFREIFDDPRWPSDPSLYVCAPSVTDPTVAPPDHENLFVLVPMAAGIQYSEADLHWYREKILHVLSEVFSVPDLADRLVFERTFCVRDFEERYNSFKGSALGFAHTLRQTAVFRPNNVSKKVKGLYYVGAGTNPGIGMPICLVSAELVYKRINGIRDPQPLPVKIERERCPGGEEGKVS